MKGISITPAEYDDSIPVVVAELNNVAAKQSREWKLNGYSISSKDGSDFVSRQKNGASLAHCLDVARPCLCWNTRQWPSGEFQCDTRRK